MSSNLILRAAALALTLSVSGLAGTAYAESSLGEKGATYPQVQTQSGNGTTVAANPRSAATDAGSTWTKPATLPAAPVGALGIN